MNMKSLKLYAAALAVSALCATTAHADYIKLPVKYSQMIGYDASGTIIGADWRSDALSPSIMADDFLCTSLDPIVAVRWWGSYVGEGPNSGLTPRPTTPPATIAFNIVFYDSTGNSIPGVHPFSVPTTVLLPQPVLAQEDFVGVDQSGDFVYRYDAYLPQWFYQQGTTANPIEYFMSIDQPSLQNWGWHEAPTQIMDFPAISGSYNGPWNNLPIHDMAFELMTIPEPGIATLGGFGLLALLISRRRR
jgi:hypothetical protein